MAVVQYYEPEPVVDAWADRWTNTGGGTVSYSPPPTVAPKVEASPIQYDGDDSGGVVQYDPNAAYAARMQAAAEQAARAEAERQRIEAEQLQRARNTIDWGGGAQQQGVPHNIDAIRNSPAAAVAPGSSFGRPHDVEALRRGQPHNIDAIRNSPVITDDAANLLYRNARMFQAPESQDRGASIYQQLLAQKAEADRLQAQYHAWRQGIYSNPASDLRATLGQADRPLWGVGELPPTISLQGGPGGGGGQWGGGYASGYRGYGGYGGWPGYDYGPVSEAVNNWMMGLLNWRI